MNRAYIYTNYKKDIKFSEKHKHIFFLIVKINFKAQYLWPSWFLLQVNTLFFDQGFFKRRSQPFIQVDKKPYSNENLIFSKDWRIVLMMQPLKIL